MPLATQDKTVKSVYAYGRKHIWKTNDNKFILTHVNKDNYTEARYCNERGMVISPELLTVVYRKSAHVKCMERLGYKIIK